MGLFSFLAKMVVLGVILFVSFVAVEFALDLVDSTSQMLDPRAALDLPSPVQDAFFFIVASCVFVFFTAPACLALVGHAGSWLKHVAARTARYLVATLVCAVGFVLVGNFALTSTQGLGGVALGGEAVLVAVVASALFLLLVSRAPLLRAGSLLFDAATGAMADLRPKRMNVASVELKAAPTKPIREKEKPERVRSEAVRFQRLVQTLSSACDRVEFRLSFRDGRGRVIVSACDRAPRGEIEWRLVSVVKAHLPEYGPVACEVRSQSETGRCIPVAGVPEGVENPLEPLSRYFLENGHDGDYIVVFERKRANPFARLAATAQQRKTAAKSGGQLTKQPPVGDQVSAPVRDHAEEMHLQESVKVVERHHSPLALKCWVRVTGQGTTSGDAEVIARDASSVMVGSLSGHRPGSALRLGAPRDAPRQGKNVGKPTVLLPSEAVPFVWIPQHALGTAVVPSTEFELPPKLEGEIVLGNVVLQSGPTEHKVRLPLDDLKKHIAIFGMTGSGKTTSCFSLLMQLYRLGVPFLVIEPVKDEYRTLSRSIPSLQVFTPGDEETAPFRLNVFEPPAGVRVQTHMENLVAAWNSSFVMYSPTQYVLAQVVANTYRACGWDVARDARGRPVTLGEMRRQTEQVCRELGYEERVTMDIEAAIKTRISSLTLGGKRPMFDSVASTPVEDLLRRPTVVELRRIASDEEKAFVAALILMRVAEHVETRGRSGQLRHVTVIEEAHRLLPNLSTQKGDPEGSDPRRRMVEQFANMLAEIRAYGEGLAIVEQIPTKILPDAIKNTATKVAHRVPAADDRAVLAGAMNMSEEQEAAFAALRPGDAVVSVEAHAYPIRVQAPDVARELGLPLGEVGDGEVRRRMAEYYLRNPLPKAPEGLRREEMLRMVGSEWFAARFTEAYRALALENESGPLKELLVEASRKLGAEGSLEVAGEVLALAAKKYLPFDEKDRERFPKAFMRRVERSMRNARGS